MEISIKLSEESAIAYATYYGFVDDGVISLQDFVTNKILDRITNDITEHNNRMAMKNATKVIDITSDGSQTALKESITSAKLAKEEEIKTFVEEARRTKETEEAIAQAEKDRLALEKLISEGKINEKGEVL